MAKERRFYHRTTEEAARAILAGGFRDRRHEQLGVEGIWLSDRPLDCNEGTSGDTLLAISIRLADATADFYEVIGEADIQNYREWCFPSALINAEAVVRVVAEEGNE